jgi:predicted GIY-YIG superfamily endonuclease
VQEEKTYFVYIMSNRSKTLYTGVTNSLMRRVREHKLGIGSVFSAKYQLDRFWCISNALKMCTMRFRARR